MAEDDRAAAKRIVRVTLDEQTFVRRSAEVEHERKVAIFDLLEENHCALAAGEPGPYALHLSIRENRLVIDVARESGDPLACLQVPLSQFRRIVKDYFTICESYYNAIKRSSPSQIEAIDMGRRALHNEGSELLRQRLGPDLDVDENTARRLFTLVCVLHIRA
ncbi:MAG: UPF0262 family protein [Alphaproteobacteria bacterium]|nr:UPF0262 family protein [Alphaproteobacteria bacterium]